MTFSQKTLSKRLRDANPFVRTEIMAQLATSPQAKEREALGTVLADHTNAFGARSTLTHLSQDENNEVRAAAIKTATGRGHSGDSYHQILLTACLDSCVEVRHLAIAGVQKGIHMGIVKNVPQSLVACVRSSDPGTQEHALNAIKQLARVHPPSAFGAYQELSAQPSTLGARVVPRMIRHLKRLEGLFPLRARTISIRLRKRRLKASNVAIGGADMTRCVSMTQLAE